MLNPIQRSLNNPLPLSSLAGWQEENLSHVSKGDFVARIHKMEVERSLVPYMAVLPIALQLLSLAGQGTLCYLQLSKDQNKEGESVLVSTEFLNCALQIEKYVVHILETEASRDSGSSLLSPEELAYAKEYADSLDSHLNTLLLRHMPSNCQKIDRKKAGKGWCQCRDKRVKGWPNAG